MNENEMEIQTEEVVEQNDVEQQTETAPAEIPAELQGLEPETIKEAMAEIAELEKSNEEETPATVEETATAEPGSDTKQETEPNISTPKQKIPYARFKEVLDKNNDLKAELEALKAQQARQQQQTPTLQPAPAQQPQQTPAPQGNGLRLTPEMSKQIDDAIANQAMLMSGLTKDEIEGIDYMDDDDPRRNRYAHAKELAKTHVYAAIENARQQQAQRYQQMVAYHNQVVQGFNDFYKQETAEADYAEVVGFATGEYFNSLPDDEKPIIADAYARVERNTASPQDVALVKRFYLDAKNSYRSKAAQAAKAAQAEPPNSTTKNLETKFEKAKAFPRAGQISGSTGATGAPSAEALERMLVEVPWDEIPQEYKDLVMNTSINY